MFQEILQQIGLSQNEAKIYEALLKLGEANTNKISVKSKVHRRNVYDSLDRLIEKGLVSETFIKGEKHFKATNPEKLNEILKEKESSLNTILPNLKTLYNSKESTAEAYFFKGIEGFKNYLQLILEQKQTVYFIGAKAFWLDPRLQVYLRHFDKERKKRKIKFIHLFDHEIKKEKPEILKLVGKPYKFLPKEYSSLTAIDIVGDYVITFVGVQPGKLDEEPLQFILKSKLLADGYRKLFQFMWDHCKEE